MLSQEFCKSAREQYERRAAVLQPVAKEIEKQAQCLNADEAAVLRWYYATMPICDAGEYAPNLLAQIAKHALMLRENVSWCAALPEDIFLRDVAYYRINSERIELYAPGFYKELYQMVCKKPITEAIIAINYWCAEHVAYVSSDQRTASPLTTLRAGLGRCGEESTFTVAALRSVGIAARQVYTPRWAHCDDNHAWVEAYANGEWCFFGACEPEEVLNRGWFTSAASRAMLIHARSFAPDLTGGAGECIGHEGVTTFYNATPLYADTKHLQIQVLMANNAVGAGAEITLEILNMAEFSRIATLQADENGLAFVNIGKGDVRVCAQCDGLYAMAECKADMCEITLTLAMPLKDFVQEASGLQMLDAIAPPAAVRPHGLPTANQQELNALRLKQAAACRKEQEIQNYNEEMAKELSASAEPLLRLSRGNFHEIWSFLKMSDEPLGIRLLKVLAEKDLLDAKAELLQAHLREAQAICKMLRTGADKDGNPVFGSLPEDIFDKSIMCPRIGFEELTDYRGFILSYFTKEQKTQFVNRPLDAWQYIQGNIGYDNKLDYKTIVPSPIASLTMGFANEAAKGVLFVAICRTLGIPARLNPVSKIAEYYENGLFVPVATVCKGKEEAKLCLQVKKAEDFVYFKAWTLGILRENGFVTLDYTDIEFDEGNRLELCVKPGIYRLITSARMPNGAQNASIWTGELKNGQSLTLEPELRTGRLEEYLMKNPLETFTVTTESGEKHPVQEMLGQAPGLIAFLDEGAEPTSHVLNELLEQQAAVREAGLAPLFILREGQSKLSDKLTEVVKALKGARICYAPFGRELEALARQMFTDHEKLPLLVVTADDLCGRYACSGYNVGSVDLILKVIRTIKNGGGK